MSPTDESLADLAQRIRGLADELADLALDRLLDATERDVEDPKTAVVAERRLTRAARALEKAAGEIETLSGSGAGSLPDP